MNAIPLIPRTAINGRPWFFNPKFSPDGKRVAFLAFVNGVLHILVGAPLGLSSATPVASVRGHLRWYRWAYDNRHLLILCDKNGNEKWQLSAVDTQTCQVRHLTPGENDIAAVVELNSDHPADILVAVKQSDTQSHDLCRFNIETGACWRAQTSGHIDRFITHAFTPRFGLRWLPDGGIEWLRSDGEQWHSFMTIPVDDVHATHFEGFDKTGLNFFLRSPSERDTSALYSVDAQSGKRTLLAEDLHVDVGEVLRSPIQKHVQAVTFHASATRRVVLDKEIEPVFEFLRRVEDREWCVATRSHDDTKWIVGYYSDSGPARFYLYDRTINKARFLFADRKKLNAHMAAMQRLEIPARDGLRMTAYLTLPSAVCPLRAGRPDTPLPMVLSVHGGPWIRDTWGFSTDHQWLANRGYAVLSVNFRGSLGFGKAFLNGGRREWAGRMHEDLLDAVAWAVQEGVAEAGRIAILGGSYGGYAAQVAMSFTPDVFACGISFAGISDLELFLAELPPHLSPELNLLNAYIGDHRSEEGRAFLACRSPINFAARVKRPLLIAHGSNDPRVRQAQSERMIERLCQCGAPVTYVVFPDEGHGFRFGSNWVSFTAIAEAFLAQHIGGRCEPIGNDFLGSNFTVPAGVERIPGLAEALRKGVVTPADLTEKALRIRAKTRGQ